MRFEERQEKVRKFAYETIDDLAEEIGVDVPFYPRVFLVGRKTHFDEFHGIGISRDAFERVKGKGSFYFPRQKTILIGDPTTVHVSEESAHFLHLTCSGLNIFNKNPLDKLCALAITEMFGFFGSKLIVPYRKNFYNPKKDVLPKKLDELKLSFAIASSIADDDANERKDKERFFTHRQGYGLGEKLYDYYISELIPMKKIRRIFTSGLKRKYDALKMFVKLKYRVLR